MASFKLLLLTFFTFLLLAGCSDSVPNPGAPSATVAFANDENVYYLDTQKGLCKQLIGGGYYQARLSPDKTKVACIYENDFYVTILNLDANLELEGKPKTVYNNRALPSGDNLGKSYYPTWSADGNKIYFLNSNHLVSYDYQEKRTTVLFDFPANLSGGLSPENGNMGLSRNGNTLFCMLSDGPDKASFWRIDSAGQGTPLASMDKPSLLGFHFPPELPDECIETLFGSRENPVWNPAISNDGQIYFYVEKEEGVLAKTLLEVYDRTQKSKFEAMTLGRAFSF